MSVGDVVGVPALSPCDLASGVGGQVAVAVTVTYPGEEPTRVEFVGSVYGGPVVMVHPRLGQMFVQDPGRFGVFHQDRAAWVRAFFDA